MRKQEHRQELGKRFFLHLFFRFIMADDDDGFADSMSVWELIERDNRAFEQRLTGIFALLLHHGLSYYPAWRWCSAFLFLRAISLFFLFSALLWIPIL